MRSVAEAGGSKAEAGASSPGNKNMECVADCFMTACFQAAVARLLALCAQPNAKMIMK